MYSNHIEDFKETVKRSSDADFLNVIAKGALKMSDEQISTASFIFWLVYMIETGMDEANKFAWSVATEGASLEEIEQLKRQMSERVGKIQSPDVRTPKYFSEQVKIYEAVHGITEQSKFLQKILGLRNDLSHRRINNLKYNGESLFDRHVKEKILLDYFEFSTNPDLSGADFWNKMSDVEKAEYRNELNGLDRGPEAKVSGS